MFNLIATPIGWIFSLLHFILVIYGLFSVLTSNRPLVDKLLWSLVIILFPFAGLLFYFLIG